MGSFENPRGLVEKAEQRRKSGRRKVKSALQSKVLKMAYHCLHGWLSLWHTNTQHWKGWME